MARHAEVVVTIDLTPFAQAMRVIADAVRTVALHHRRAYARFGYTAGDRHIDRICTEICHQLATGAPGRDPVARLIAASDFAQILDRRTD